MEETFVDGWDNRLLYGAVDVELLSSRASDRFRERYPLPTLPNLTTILLNNIPTPIPWNAWQTLVARATRWPTRTTHFSTPTFAPSLGSTRCSSSAIAAGGFPQSPEHENTCDPSSPCSPRT